MNSRVPNGVKTRKFLAAWGAAVLIALAVVLLWSSHEKKSAQTMVPGLHNSLNDRNLVLTDSGQRHQDATMQLTPEPMSQSSNSASAESIADQSISDSTRDHTETELVDRTPRPYAKRRSMSGCLDHPDSLPCMSAQPMAVEPIDPNWSSKTEGRLRDIWRESVAEMSDQFLFVECKTTICEVNYRFPQGTTRGDEDRCLTQYLAALRASELAAELHLSVWSYGRSVQAWYFKRTTSQREP
jgi:hypothetical protein